MSPQLIRWVWYQQCCNQSDESGGRQHSPEHMRRIFDSGHVPEQKEILSDRLDNRTLSTSSRGIKLIHGSIWTIPGHNFQCSPNTIVERLNVRCHTWINLFFRSFCSVTVRVVVLWTIIVVWLCVGECTLWTVCGAFDTIKNTSNPIKTFAGNIIQEKITAKL